MTAAGYKSRSTRSRSSSCAPPLLQQTAPIAATYETGAFTGTGSGNVTAAVTPVDINLVPPRDQHQRLRGRRLRGLPGRQHRADPARHLHLRGKALNAQAAGASAVIIFNQGNTPDREGLIIGTLAPSTATIPVVGASFADGAALAQAGLDGHDQRRPAAEHHAIQRDRRVARRRPEQRGHGRRAPRLGPARARHQRQRLGLGGAARGRASRWPRSSRATSCASPGGAPRSPGWSARPPTSPASADSDRGQDRAVPELRHGRLAEPRVLHLRRRQLRRRRRRRRARTGRRRSRRRSSASSRSAASRSRAPTSPAAPTTARSSRPASRRAACSPAPKASRRRRRRRSGAAPPAQQYDPCYHLACDTFANNNDFALDVNADAIAYATLQYAMNTQDVNGQRGKGNFKKLVVPYPKPEAR